MADEEVWFGLGLSGAGFVTGFLGKRTAWLARRKLGALIFWQDGMRSRIARIALGNGQHGDLEEIALILRTTQDDTDGAYAWLRKHRERLVRALGPDVAQKIDYVTYRKMGPGAVRDQLKNMVGAQSLEPDWARAILDKMDEFNALLQEIRAR